MKTLIKNGYLITVDASDTCSEGCVLVENDTIAYAGPEENAPQVETERVIDTQGGIIMPGFVNTHTHVPMTMMRGYADDLALMDWLQNQSGRRRKRPKKPCIGAACWRCAACGGGRHMLFGYVQFCRDRQSCARCGVAR